MGYSQGLDLTTGRPMHKIGLFALPVIIGNLVQECYNLADTLIVGQTLGVEKLAGGGIDGIADVFDIGVNNWIDQRMRGSYIAIFWEKR